MNQSSATRIRFGIAALFVSFAVGGCSGGGAGGETTCSEWHALSPSLDEQLSTMEPLTGKQEDIIEKMLRDHRKDDLDAMNVTNAGLQIQQFCGVDDSGNWMNENSPIEAGVDLT